MKRRPPPMGVATTLLLFLFGFGILIPEVIWIFTATDPVGRAWIPIMICIAVGVLVIACITALMTFRPWRRSRD